MSTWICFQGPTHTVSYLFIFKAKGQVFQEVMLELDFLVSYTKRLLSSFDKLCYFVSFNFCIMFNKTKKIKSSPGLLKQK